jgi:hypothetical protein
MTETLSERMLALRERRCFEVNRRHMLKGAGMFLGASGAHSALAIPAGATSEDKDADEIVGLWQGVVSAQDNSFPPFRRSNNTATGLGSQADKRI